jgi:hypothetical protein
MLGGLTFTVVCRVACGVVHEDLTVQVGLDADAAAIKQWPFTANLANLDPNDRHVQTRLRRLSDQSAACPTGS